MQIVIVAPCRLPHPLSAATPPQVAMHLAASTPVRHRVKIVDAASTHRACAEHADLYVLLWSENFSPTLIEIAMQLATCEHLICVWDGPTAAPIDYLLEFFDQVVSPTQRLHWQQLLATIDSEKRQAA